MEGTSQGSLGSNLHLLPVTRSKGGARKEVGGEG